MTETITWVDVNERKPEYSEDVLLVVKGSIKKVRTGYWDGVVWMNEMNNIIPLSHVTHWAELPKGPQVQA